MISYTYIWTQRYKKKLKDLTIFSFRVRVILFYWHQLPREAWVQMKIEDSSPQVLPRIFRKRSAATFWDHCSHRWDREEESREGESIIQWIPYPGFHNGGGYVFMAAGERGEARTTRGREGGRAQQCRVSWFQSRDPFFFPTLFPFSPR